MSDFNRRQFLSLAAALPCSMLLGSNSLAATTRAKSGRLRGPIHELEGDVFINKNIANPSSTIQSGDRLSVAYGGRLVFSMGEDTYFYRKAVR